MQGREIVVGIIVRFACVLRRGVSLGGYHSGQDSEQDNGKDSGQDNGQDRT